VQRPLADLPRAIQRVGVLPGVWLVGGGALWVLGDDKPPKDWDFFVEPDAHAAVLSNLRGAALATNSFGGLKITVDGLVIDLWVSSLARFVTHGTGNVAISLLYSKVVRW